MSRVLASRRSAKRCAALAGPGRLSSRHHAQRAATTVTPTATDSDTASRICPRCARQCPSATGAEQTVTPAVVPSLAAVPRLSEFYGIVIYMYFSDHNPPHFHAIYAEYEALVRIDDGGLIGGACRERLPSL